MIETKIYWIEPVFPGRLGIMPCPGGVFYPDKKVLAREIKELSKAGVDILVSMLTADEAPGLADEAAFCADNEIRFLSYPIPDFKVPASMQDTYALVRGLADDLAEGKGIAAHCYAGLGRSALIAACTLVACGMTGKQACETLSKARGCSVPITAEQTAWVELFQTFQASLPHHGIQQIHD
ncbi:MAG: tyrosine protein phosphatase [Gammaproteobacteria bacterium]|nr:tyrosine protein phosphatase [Gammaproteobacteria bacterium]